MDSEKNAAETGGISSEKLLLVFALLISNTAAGLAGRLTGSLALAATAILCALTQIASFDCRDMFHGSNLH